jgi:hypothetical protein
MTSQALVVWRASDHAVVPFRPRPLGEPRAPVRRWSVRRVGTAFSVDWPETESNAVCGLVIVCRSAVELEEMCERLVPMRFVA